MACLSFTRYAKTSRDYQRGSSTFYLYRWYGDSIGKRVRRLPALRGLVGRNDETMSSRSVCILFLLRCVLSMILIKLTYWTSNTIFRTHLRISTSMLHLHCYWTSKNYGESGGNVFVKIRGELSLHFTRYPSTIRISHDPYLNEGAGNMATLRDFWLYSSYFHDLSFNDDWIFLFSPATSPRVLYEQFWLCSH